MFGRVVGRRPKWSNKWNCGLICTIIMLSINQLVLVHSSDFISGRVNQQVSRREDKISLDIKESSLRTKKNEDSRPNDNNNSNNNNDDDNNNNRSQVNENVWPIITKIDPNVRTRDHLALGQLDLREDQHENRSKKLSLSKLSSNEHEHESRSIFVNWPNYKTSSMDKNDIMTASEELPSSSNQHFELIGQGEQVNRNHVEVSGADTLTTTVNYAQTKGTNFDGRQTQRGNDRRLTAPEPPTMPTTTGTTTTTSTSTSTSTSTTVNDTKMTDKSVSTKKDSTETNQSGSDQGTFMEQTIDKIKNNNNNIHFSSDRAPIRRLLLDAAKLRLPLAELKNIISNGFRESVQATATTRTNNNNKFMNETGERNPKRTRIKGFDSDKSENVTLLRAQSIRGKTYKSKKRPQMVFRKGVKVQSNVLLIGNGTEQVENEPRADEIVFDGNKNNKLDKLPLRTKLTHAELISSNNHDDDDDDDNNNDLLVKWNHEKPIVEHTMMVGPPSAHLDLVGSNEKGEEEEEEEEKKEGDTMKRMEFPNLKSIYNGNVSRIVTQLAPEPLNSSSLVNINRVPINKDQTSQEDNSKFLTLKKKTSSGYQVSPLAKSTSLGIRVITGKHSGPLVINNRGLITAAKGKLAPGSSFINHANLLSNQKDYSLSPTMNVKQKLGPISVFIDSSDHDERPTFLKRPISLPNSDSPTYLSSSNFTLATSKPSRPSFSSDSFANDIALQSLDEMSQPEDNQSDSSIDINPGEQVVDLLSTNHRKNSTKLNGFSLKQQYDSYNSLDSNLYHLNRTNSSIENHGALSTRGNQPSLQTQTLSFQHNPPYTKLHQSNYTTDSHSPSRTGQQPNVVYNNGRGHQNRPNSMKNQTTSSGQTTPASSSGLIDYGTTTVTSVYTEPQSIGSAINKPAINSLLRNKIHDALKSKLLANKATQNNLTVASQFLSNSQQVQQYQPTPAPLLSSTAANNLASLLAQGFTHLIQGPMDKNGHSSRFNSVLANRLRRRINHMSNTNFDRNHGLIDKRTNSVGSLLFSGFIYGLSVLPALMALTGNNPFNGLSFGEDGPIQNPSSKRGGTASSQDISISKLGGGSERSKKTNKSPRPHHTTRLATNGPARLPIVGLDPLLASTYLIPFGSMAPIETSAHTSIPNLEDRNEMRAPLKLFIPSTSAPFQNYLTDIHPLLDADNDVDLDNPESVDLDSLHQRETSKKYQLDDNSSGGSAYGHWPINKVHNLNQKTSKGNAQGSNWPNSDSDSSSEEDRAKISQISHKGEEPEQTAFTPLILVPFDSNINDENRNSSGGISSLSSASSRNVVRVANSRSNNENSNLHNIDNHKDLGFNNLNYQSTKSLKRSSSHRPQFIPLATVQAPTFKPKLPFIDHPLSELSRGGFSVRPSYQVKSPSPVSSNLINSDITILGPFNVGSEQVDQTVSFVPLNAVEVNTAASNRGPNIVFNDKNYPPSTDMISPIKSKGPFNLQNSKYDRIALMSYKPISANKLVQAQGKNLSKSITQRVSLGDKSQEFKRLEKTSKRKPQSWHLFSKSTWDNKRLDEKNSSKDNSTGSVHSVAKSKSNPKRAEQKKKGHYDDSIREILLAHTLALGSRVVNEPDNTNQV